MLHIFLVYQLNDSGDVKTLITYNNMPSDKNYLNNFLEETNSIFDDLLLSSVLATFIIIFVDIYFSTLTGYSLIKDSEEILQTVIMAVSTYNPNIILPEYYSSLVIYLSIATIPVGTVIAVYLGAMFLGNKLRILDKNTKRKFNIIKQFNKYGAFL